MGINREIPEALADVHARKHLEAGLDLPKLPAGLPACGEPVPGPGCAAVSGSK
jgi:hypothetical protein